MSADAGYPWLGRPKGLTDGPKMHAYFADLADQLINQCRLVVNGQAHRFAEIEFYYCAPEHTDLFAHRDPLQETRGRWYFHKTKGVYRGGSFKGFDLTFGAPAAHGGILIRSLEKPDGTLVDGPSLSVDHLLATTKCTAVAVLDKLIASRSVWDATNPMHLQETSPGSHKPILATARVGLTLKKVGKDPAIPSRFVVRRYRFLSEPRRLSKGKIHMVLALHQDDKSVEEIVKATGCPRKSVERYIADFKQGQEDASFDPFVGADLGPAELCKLHGVARAVHGVGVLD
jgi:hypothetical protein